MFPRSLQYLMAIAEYGSYTRAAEALHVSQPTLSQQIKQLEESLKSPLLDRSGRTVRLTDAGEVYVHHARRARGELDAGRRAINDVKNLSRGSLRLGWNPITDYLTCPLLEDFISLHPGITLSTLEMPQDDIEAAVAEDRIDIGIAFGKLVSKVTTSNEIESELLFEEKLCLAVGNEHPLAGKKKRMTAKEFGKQSLALLNTDFALRTHIDRYCLDNSILPHVPMESNSLSVIMEMIQVGRLATVLPNGIVHTQCGLYSIELSPELPNKAITLFYRKGGYKSPACQAFSELASEWAVSRLKEIPIRRRRPCPLSEPFYEAENQVTPG
ncbi:MAG: transcriptional regulator CynR [Alphaproteobacteria bacterium]|nr:transcriptional regulator CynR [Alphaproteobacteria bacterium]